MRSADTRGEDVLSLYGGAAVERALDIGGPQEEEDHERTFTAGMYDKHADRIGDSSYKLGRYRWGLERLAEIYEANIERYAEVSARTNLPPELIAALHFRESSGDFSTYLHQGDPLGRPAVNHPANIPLFHDWEPAAEHALNDPYKKRIQDDLGLSADTTDLAAMGAYAEYYNGLGYHNKGRTSPYVYAGTDAYRGGKYVSDGRYNSRVYDQQPGVVAMVQVMRGEEVTDGVAVHEHKLGDRHLELGRQGRDVRALQQQLLDLGFDPNGVDGHFGPGTRAAVKAFQVAAGLPVDGMVGEATVDSLKTWRPGNGLTIE
jgi:lysozyme family protein